MSIAKLKKKLQRLEVTRKDLVKDLMSNDDLAVGSVSTVRRKCGKPNCHCAEGEGHLQTLFLFKGEDGQRQCKLVRNEDCEEMTEAGEKYRKFRSDLRKLRAIEKEEYAVLLEIMNARAVKYE